MNSSGFPSPGSSIGHYRVISEIARGSMGIIFLGEHESLHQPVAIKMLPHSMTQDPSYVKRFYIEAEAAAKLNHPNIATVHDILEDYDTHFFVMDFVEGMSLERKKEEEEISFEQATQIIFQVLQGLVYAHQEGVIHRDIKPANIMISTDGTAIITDFGLAKIENATVLTVDGTILGTPSYMSPEQVRAEEITPLSDIFSTGVVFYELLTGRSPFFGSNHMITMKKVLEENPPDPTRIKATIPKDLETITMKAIEKEPSRRFSSAQAFLEDIERHTQGEPILAIPASLLTKIQKKLIKQRKLLMPLFIFLVIGGLFLSFREYKHRQQVKKSQNILSDAMAKNQVLLDKLSQDPLFRVLKDKDPFVRSNALVGIHKKIRGKKTFGSLTQKTMLITIQALFDPYSEVRKNAAILMGLLKDPDLAQPLIRRLKEEDHQETKVNIIIALGWIEDESALEVLHQELENADPKIKASILLALGMIASKKSSRFILQKLEDSDPQTRANAALALAEINDPMNIPYLLPLTKDLSELVRQAADKSIKHFGQVSRIPIMQYILADRSAEENSVAKIIQSIEVQTDQVLLSLLHFRLNDESEKIRTYAVITTGLFQNPESIPHLIERLDDPSNVVIENAHLALIGITQKNFGKKKSRWEKWYLKKSKAPAGEESI